MHVLTKNILLQALEDAIDMAEEKSEGHLEKGFRGASRDFDLAASELKTYLKELLAQWKVEK